MLAAEKAVLLPAAPEAKVIPLRPAVSTATWLRLAGQRGAAGRGRGARATPQPAGNAGRGCPAGCPDAGYGIGRGDYSAGHGQQPNPASECRGRPPPGPATRPYRCWVSTLNGDPNPQRAPGRRRRPVPPPRRRASGAGAGAVPTSTNRPQRADYPD